MAVGRSRFRPGIIDIQIKVVAFYTFITLQGKRSIATGRTGFRPGKRSHDAFEMPIVSDNYDRGTSMRIEDVIAEE